MARYSFRQAIRMLSVGLLGTVGMMVGGESAIAQNVIIPDNTLGAESSTVVPLSTTVDGIQGGAQRGENLFHSFEQFDIGGNTGLYFLTDSNTIDNIFARISTQDVSELLGILGVRQLTDNVFSQTPANLYIINPNGIVFGPNSVLDIGGSFVATTANSVAFSDDSSFDSLASMGIPTNLTISPSAYLFSGQNIGEINVQSVRVAASTIDRGLQVPSFENLSLIGGNISINGLGFDAGLTARGGNINAIAIREGRVSIVENGALSISDSATRGNLNIGGLSRLSTALDNGGNILLLGRDISVSDSVVEGGIVNGFGSAGSLAGNISLDASNRIVLSNASVLNVVGARNIIGSPQETVGDSGNIFIKADELRIENGTQVNTSTARRGDAGNITIMVHSLTLSGATSDGLQLSAIQSVSEPTAVGSSGDISILATRSLLIENGAGITASAFGQGHVGEIQIYSDSVSLRGVDASGFGGSINTRVGASGMSIEENENGARPNAITITANDSLTLQDGAQLIAGTSNSADSSNIAITAGNFVIRGATNTELGRVPSGVLTSSVEGASGQGGDIFVDAESLIVDAGGAISSRSQGSGRAGNIDLNIEDGILVRDSDIDTISTQNSGGNVTIRARTLTLEGDGDITTRIFQGGGSGGRVDIEATRFVLASGDSDIIAAAPQGSGGNIILKTPSFFGIGFDAASLDADPDTLDGNNRVDVNATGISNGSVDLPSNSFLENSLSSLPDNLIAPDQLIASSCIARSADGQGTLVETGSDSLAANPDSASASPLPTGTVQAIATAAAQSTENLPQTPNISIEEPTGVYQLADGRLVMAQSCL